MPEYMSPREKIVCRSGKNCDVPGCFLPVSKFSRYCGRHDLINERTGHPLGYTITKGKLRPYLEEARRFLALHRDHPGIEDTLKWFGWFMATANPPSRIHTRSSASARFEWWRAALHKAGAAPEELLAVLLGMFLLQEHEPRAFKSDRHFQHQVVVRLLRLAAPGRDSRGRQQRNRITVGVREALAQIMVTSRLGGFCLRIVRQIEEERKRVSAEGLTGLEEPFKAST